MNKPDSPYHKALAKRTARQRPKIQQWLDAAKIPAVEFIATVAARDADANNRGRPLDMGGPRNRWIETELWELVWIDFAKNL